MLTVGDKCVIRNDSCEKPDFGIISIIADDGEGFVFYESIIHPGFNRWVGKGCVTPVKSLRDLNISQSASVYLNESNSGSGRCTDENADLCDRMDKLSTFDETEEEAMSSEEQLESSLPEWRAGDLCVCRWWKDNKWYFGKITQLRFRARYCAVRFLHYGEVQHCIRIDRLHRVDASTFKWVADKNNASALQKLLRSGDKESCGMKLPAVLPELESHSRGVVKSEDRGKRGKWRPALPVLSPFWRTLLLELHGSHENAVEELLNSAFKSGFRRGYRRAQKTENEIA